ncbi:MAG: RNA 2',3'-cyclic phosphodiesterase [bacterium]
MRAFIALDLPYEIKNFITVQIFDLKKHFDYHDIKWVSTHNYHLTFRFFENIDQDYAKNNFQKLKEEFRDFKEFKISILEELGFFYNQSRIKVIFLKVEPLDVLYEIYKKISKIFGEDRFSPHITIGRVKKVISPSSQDILKKYRIEPVSFVAKEITLFKSLLNPLGSVYHKIDSIFIGS